MHCRHCGKELTEESVFCPFCGEKQNNAGQQTVKRNHTKEAHSKRVAVIVAIAVLVVALLIVGFLLLRPVQRELDATQIAKLSESVLTLYVYDKNNNLVATGSGFVVNDDRTLVTNYHVIDQGYFVEAVSEADVRYNLQGISFYDETSDIAILKFESNTGLKPLAVADSSLIQVGDIVYAIGSPLGLKNTVSNGIVSAMRTDSGSAEIQITAPISSGSSGGALLNAFGQVIGITSAYYAEGQNLNLAIPSAEFVSQLSASGTTSFDVVAKLLSPIGNTLENYSSDEVRLVQYGSMLFESYNGKDEIILHDLKTNTNQALGLYGRNLSVFRDVLYFVPYEDTKSTLGLPCISTYNLSSGEQCENIVAGISELSNSYGIRKVFVTKYGISIVYMDKLSFSKSNFMQIDFQGNILGDFIIPGVSPCLASNDLLVSYSFENRELFFIDLSTLETYSLPLDFEPNSVAFISDGLLLIEDTTNDSCGVFVKYDLYSGEFSRLSLTGASRYGGSVYYNDIFYCTEEGTAKLSLNGLSNKPKIICRYLLRDICFADIAPRLL